VLGRRLPDRQFHRHQRASRGAAFLLSLPAPLPEMAIQRALTQTLTAAKFAPPHAAVHKLRHQLNDFRSGPSPMYRYPLISLHCSSSPQTALLVQVR
jgi:hypothetical protein